ncbi:MAG: FecR domain-containing protein [Bacteroidales bacterium]|nr:FecR domain-containing protein [Bacteroidales bacterium]
MNGENLHITEELITKYLLKETSDAENTLIEQWLEAAPENRALLLRHKTVLDMLAFANADTDIEWQNFKTKLKPRTKEINLNYKTKPVSLRYWSIAASVLIIITLSIILNIYFNKEKMLTAETFDNIEEIALSDGSEITLNRNSVLHFPDKFSNDKRLVQLNGEAHFQVKSDNSKPFIVEANKLTVTVLGTSFYIRAYKDGREEVYVESGKVRCEHAGTNENIDLIGGEKYLFGTQTHEAEILTQNDKNSWAWKTASLAFVDMPLSHIVNQINNAYGCRITVNENLSDCHLTVNFDDLTLDGVLTVLQSILDFESNKEGKNIEITGNGC